MEAVYSSETFVNISNITLRINPEDQTSSLIKLGNTSLILTRLEGAYDVFTLSSICYFINIGEREKGLVF
jgi:hypothetical protein